MKTLDEILYKKPETFKEKLEDIWDDITCYYPKRIKDGWWAIKRFFRNLRKYWEILWDDNDFDQGYMEKLLIKKLSLMADYFRTSRIAYGNENVYEKINLAIRVGKIGFDMNPEEDSPEDYGGKYGFDYLGYVNTKNYKRYWNSPLFDESNSNTNSYLITELRKQKARYIFYKILLQYSQSWWD